MSVVSRSVCAVLASAPLVLAGCASQSPAVQEYLDPQTAMTIRVVSEPYVYAHDVPELAANVRDFLSVGAVELNNMGSHKLYFVLVSWSTVDRKRAGIAPPALADALELMLDGKERNYLLVTHEPRTIGAGIPVLEPPSGYLGESWYAAPVADLRAFNAAPPASIDVIVDGTRVTYTLWRRADAALGAFIEQIPTVLTPLPRRR